MTNHELKALVAVGLLMIDSQWMHESRRYLKGGNTDFKRLAKEAAELIEAVSTQTDSEPSVTVME
jgi:hypothetical protein